MKLISKDEYDALIAFMKSQILALWNHENEWRSEANKLEFTQTGFPIVNILKYNIERDNCLYLVFNNTFLDIVKHKLILATNIYPELFGTGNPYDVMEAIWRTSGMDSVLSKEQYINFLSNKPCYVVYKNGEQFDHDILRIDLFRDIFTGSDGNTDFRGGLFHILKHFSVNGVNLSIGHDINDVFDVHHVLYLSAMAFRQKERERGNDYISRQQLYANSHILKYIFFYEQESGVYFIKTCHLE